MSELLRHIEACNNAALPGRRLPFRVGAAQAGWVLPEFAAEAAVRGARLGVRLGADGLRADAGVVPALARALAEAGLLWWRDESFDVRALEGDEASPVLAQIDRGALPKFGIAALGVHLNGLVGERLWVGFRSRTKRLDPGKLDHLVAGGVAAGHGVWTTLAKEAGEEAGLPESLVQEARPVSVIRYTMEREEGLRRDVLHCFDLELPDGFTPLPHDDEVERFELWGLDAVEERLRRTDDFKFNVALVLIDLLIRRERLPRGEAGMLSAALEQVSLPGARQ